MKFKFYYKGNKKKSQVLDIENKKDLKLIATIAKAEISKNSILNDIDFSDGKLICKVKDKEFNMKELWQLIEQRLESDDNSDKKKKDKKKKKSNNKAEKSKKKSKKKKDKQKSKSNKNESSELRKSNGLIHIGKRQ